MNACATQKQKLGSAENCALSAAKASCLLEFNAGMNACATQKQKLGSAGRNDKTLVIIDRTLEIIEKIDAVDLPALGVGRRVAAIRLACYHLQFTPIPNSHK